MWRSLAFVLLGCCWGSAFKLVGSPTHDQYVTNGKISQNTTIQVECDATDFGRKNYLQVQTLNGTVSVEVDCGYPTLTYDLTIKGYVPIYGEIVIGKIIVTRDQQLATNYNLTFSDYGAFLSSAGGFSVQSHDPHPQYHLMGADPQHLQYMKGRELFGFPVRMSESYVNSPHYRHNLHPVSRVNTNPSGGQVGLAVGAAAASIVFPAAGTLLVGLFGGGGGPSAAAIQALQESVGNLQTASAQFSTRFAADEKAQSDVNIQLNGTVNLLKDLVGNAQATAQAGYTLASQSRDMALALSTALANNITTINNYVGQVNAGLISLTSEVGALSSSTQADIKALFGNLSALANVTNTNLATLSNTTQHNLISLGVQLAAITGQQRLMAGQMSELMLNTPARRANNRVIVNAIVNTLQNTPYVPFTGNNGLFPAFEAANYEKLFSDSLRILSITPSLLIRQVDYSFYCYVPWLLSQGASTMTYQDLLKTLGTTNCSLTNIAGCYCYFSTVEQYCTKDPALDPLSFYTNGTNSIQSPYCQGGITSNGPALILSGPTLFGLLDVRCYEGSTNQIGYLVRSNLLGTTEWVSDDPSICGMNYEKIVSGMGSGSFLTNFIIYFFNMWEEGFGFATQGIETYARALDGLIPSNLSTLYNPFEWQPDNKVAESYTSAFMAFEPGMEAIYLLSNPSTSTPVTVNVNGTLYSTVYDVTVNPAIGYSAPQEVVLAGDPSYGATSVYDIDCTTTCLSGFPKQNQGAVTYTMVDDPSCFNITCWGAKYGVSNEFDHFAATNLLSAHIKPLAYTGVQAVCNVPIGTALGNICQMLQYLSVSSFQPNAPSPTAVFQQKVGSYTVKIPIPDGDVFLVTNTGCPQIQVAQVSGEVTRVTLTNPVGGDIKVSLVVSGDCNNVYSDLIVPAGGSTYQSIPACGNKQGTIFLSVYQVAGASLGSVCPGGFNLSVTANRTNFLATTGAADLVTVDYSSTTVAASSGAALVASTLQTNLLVVQTVFQLAKLATLVSEYVPIPDLSDYSNLLNQSQTLGQNLTVLQKTITSNPTTNVTAIAGPYDAAANKLAQEYQDSVSAFQKNMDALNANLANVSNSIKNKVATSEAAINALNDFVGNLTQFAKQVVNTFNSIPESGASVMGFFTDVINGVAGLPADVVDAGSKFLTALTNAVIKEIGTVASGIGGLFSGFTNVIIILVVVSVVICGLGGGGYYLYKRQNKLKKELPAKFSVTQIEGMSQNIASLLQEVSNLKAQVQSLLMLRATPSPLPPPPPVIPPAASVPLPPPATKGAHRKYIRPHKSVDDELFEFYERPESPGPDLDE